MSLDLLFFSPKELTDHQVRETARAWAESAPHTETAELDDGKIQLWYDNEETFVHFSLSEIDTDLTGFVEEMRPMARDAAPNGYILSPWQFNMNFFRPSFCAAEAMPHLADFARMMNFLILETHEMEIVPAEPDQLVAYWREANKRAVAVAFFNQDVDGMSVYRTGSSEPDETGTVKLDQARFEQVLTGGQDPAIDLIGIDRVLLETAGGNPGICPQNHADHSWTVRAPRHNVYLVARCMDGLPKHDTRAPEPAGKWPFVVEKPGKVFNCRNSGCPESVEGK